MTDIVPALPGDVPDEPVAATYQDVTRRGDRKPLVAEQWRLRNMRATVRKTAALYSHKAAWHALRLHLHGGRVAWYAVRGTAVVVRRGWHWKAATNLWVLESQAVAAGRAGHQHAMSAHTEGEKTRARRNRSLAAGAAVAGALLLAMWQYAPRWSFAVLGVAGLAFLVHHGKTPGKRLFEPAVVDPQYERITQDLITRALGSLSIGAINQYLSAGREIQFIAPGVGRDGAYGWRVRLDLPPGVTAAAVMEKSDNLAAALRRPAGCVWPAADQDEHPGRLDLYIGDEPLRSVKQPGWPLARAGKADIFQPLPFGTDQRGKPVSVTLMFANLLIGAISRMGKTVALRNVLLAAALDPSAELHVWELKGTGDLAALGQVAVAYGSGADDETLAACVADLRKVHAKLDERAKVISDLVAKHGTAVCPGNKVTPELARRRPLRLAPLLFAVDECQELGSHPDFRDEFERLCLQIIRRGPALGIMLVLATQRPDAKSLPTGITANIALRFCLKVMDQTANDMVLGTSAYRKGINATLLSFADKGIGWAVNFADEPMVVKGYDVDGPAAERICGRARAGREAAGLLSGYAAGIDDGTLARDVLGDVQAVFTGTGMHWTVLAERLAERFPDRWAGATAASVSGDVRAHGVQSKPVTVQRDTQRGCLLDDVRKAAGS